MAKKNWVEVAIKKAGGRKKVANLCGVATNTVHYWIQSQRVDKLEHAIKLASASGVPVERFIAVKAG